MKSNKNRRAKIFEDVLPPVGTKAYRDVVERLEKIENRNPAISEFTKKNWERITKSLEAQYLSNCDFVTENSLRHYLMEFNNRTWNHGLRSMPIMFNIMEAYFNYRKPEMYFELIEEENYLISFFSFIDFITSNEFEDNKTLIEENIESNLIYNFNVGKDLEEIKFKDDSGDEFIIAGVSIIRRNNEVTVLLITGKKKTEDISINKDLYKFSEDNPNKSDLIKEMKSTLEDNNLEYEYLDKEQKYIKVLVASRIDLETMTIDARYVAEETNLMFHVVTDEIDGFLAKGKFANDDYKKAYENSKERLKDFNVIFEVIKISLYLPYFFNLNEEIIVEESLDTLFKKEYNSPFKKRSYSNVIGKKYSIKSLFSLDVKNVFSPDTIKLRDDLFKIQSTGYWKNLAIDEIGLDKNGNPIHGRTWVSQSLSWFEAKEADLIVEKSTELFKDKNAGFIYILRNPAMEKNIFKIGLTRNDVDSRASQLSKTSVPDKFYKSQEWNVKDCVRAEKEIHIKLDSYRVDPRREFFKIDYDKAVSAIKEVIDRINEVDLQS